MNPVVHELRRMMHHSTTPSWANRAADEIERLEREGAELLAALENYQRSAEECESPDGLGMWTPMQDWYDLDDAIEKARRQT